MNGPAARSNELAVATRGTVAEQALACGADDDDEGRSSSSCLLGRVFLVPDDQAAALPGGRQVGKSADELLLPPGMPVRIPVEVSFIEGQLGLVGAVGIHDPDLLVPVAGAHERDLPPIG